MTDYTLIIKCDIKYHLHMVFFIELLNSATECLTEIISYIT